MDIDKPKIDVTAKDWLALKVLLQRHLPRVRVWAFGSRVKWTSRPDSDLDIVVFTSPEKNTAVYELKDAFAESNLAFRVDVLVWDQISVAFQANIQQQYVVLNDTNESKDTNSDLRSLWESAGGKIPEEWLIVPLESLFRDSKSIAVGVMYPGTHTEGGIPLIKVGDIKNGAAPLRPEFCISSEINYEYRRSQLIGDELLITLVGNPGECVVVKPEMAGWNPARAIAVIKLADVDLRTYLKAVLESSAGKHLINSVLNTTVQKTLNLKDIRRLPIPMPNKRVIQSISLVSESFSDRITLLRETNTTLEAIAQALFKSWFVDFDPVHAKMQGRVPEGMDEATAALFPDGFEESELGLVPRGWAMRTMADVSTVGIGKTPPRKEPQWFSENPNDIRWVSIRDMGAVGVYASETSEYLTVDAVDKFNVRRVPNNTAIMSFKMTIGRVAITDGEMTTNEAIAHFKLTADSPITTEYIYLHLKQFDFSTLSSTSSIADAVNSKTVRDIPILAPTNQVLMEFQNRIAALFAKLKNTERQAQNLSALRDTLLPRLISGQLRPNSI